MSKSSHQPKRRKPATKSKKSTNNNNDKGATWAPVENPLSPRKIEGLTVQQQRFVEELTVDWNVNRAARRAGYKSTSPNRVIKGKKVKEELERVFKAQQEMISVTREELMLELSASIRRDILDLCDENGQLYIDDLSKITPEMRKCVDGIELEERRNKEGKVTFRKYKLVLTKKLEAIQMMMKHYGMFAPQEVTLKHGIDWDSFYNQDEDDQPDNLDVIEGEIAQLENDEQ